MHGIPNRLPDASIASPSHPSTLLLARRDIALLMSQADYLDTAEEAFRALGTGTVIAPPPLHLPAGAGGFHAKGALLNGARRYAAVKLNGNFPGNPERCGLPTIQGVIVLSDADNGQLLALIDSIEVTLRRTAAATALAARHLARARSSVITVIGCGAQARAQLEALGGVLPLRQAWAWDCDSDKSAAYADQMSQLLGFPVNVPADLDEACLQSDVIVTCTTSRQPFLTRDMVRSGTFVAAVGADSPEKNEVHADLMCSSTVVADVLTQCLAMGDLHHAGGTGGIRPDTEPVELGAVLLGTAPGRRYDDEITLFDSTGCAAQDVTAAVLIHQRAIMRNLGQPFRFAGPP